MLQKEAEPTPRLAPYETYRFKDSLKGLRVVSNYSLFHLICYHQLKMLTFISSTPFAHSLFMCKSFQSVEWVSTHGVNCDLDLAVFIYDERVYMFLFCIWATLLILCVYVCIRSSG